MTRSIRRSATATLTAAAGLLCLLAVGSSGLEARERTPREEDDDEAPRKERPVRRVPAVGVGSFSPNLKPRSAGLTAGGKGDVRKVYREVAPAVVLIRALDGHGTGVIIDADDGWILTNDHVIAEAEREGYELKVKVLRGRLGEAGIMEPVESYLDAYVHKRSRDYDLAVVKLVDPPDDLVAIRLARPDAATPGEPATSVGHAGVGLLWAIKDGEIASIGKIADSHALVKMLRDSTEPLHQAQVQALLRGNFGLVIQTTCPIAQGDSGGPLVNRRSELIGLNSFGIGERAFFHVHIAEIRKFLAEIPAVPLRALPHPWEGARQAEPETADLDGDGVPEVLELTRRDGRAILFDLDQDTDGESLSDIGELVATKGFDAELALVETAGLPTHVWYDTDGDGHLDLLLASSAERVGELEQALRIPKSGAPEPTGEIAAGKILRASLLPKSQRTRFAKTAGRLFGPDLLDQSGLPAELPNPFAGAVFVGATSDDDDDGHVDQVILQGLDGLRVLVDLDGETLDPLGTLSEDEVPDAVAELVAAKKLDVEIAFVITASDIHVFYDRDDDGRFDLVVAGSEAHSLTAAKAWEIGEDGTATAAAGFAGRKLFRPGLLRTEAMAARCGEVLAGHLPSGALASDEGARSFPERAPQESFGVRLHEIGGGLVLDAQGPSRHVLVLDVDADTLGEGEAPDAADAEVLLADGRVEAEVVWVHSDGWEWVFYDTDGDGALDTVLFTSTPGAGEAEVGYRIAASGEARVDPALEGKKLITPSLVEGDELAASVRAVASGIFDARAIGE